MLAEGAGRGKTAALPHGRAASSCPTPPAANPGSPGGLLGDQQSLQPLQAAVLSKSLGWAEPRLTWAIEAVVRLQKSGVKLVEHWRRLQVVQQGRLLDSCVHQRHYNALDRRSALEAQTS